MLVVAAAVACSGAIEDPTGADARPSSSASASSEPSAPPASPPGAAPSGPASTCGEGGRALAGVAYDVSKSRFAFGSAPTREDDDDGTVRWSGVHGVLTLRRLGQVFASTNGGAPESSLPEWSDDPDALTAHVRAYFVALGVPECQIERAQVNAGSLGRTIALARGFDGIGVIESHAWARMNSADQTTVEGFHWPTIPAEYVSAAMRLRDDLAEPSALETFKAKLPANARGDGRVVVHHTTQPFASAFVYAVTWDTYAAGAPMSFDRNGREVNGSNW